MKKKYLSAILFSSLLSLFIFSTPVFAKDYSVTNMNAFKDGFQKNILAFNKNFKITYEGDINKFKKEVDKIPTKLLQSDPLLEGKLEYAYYSYTIRGNKAVVTYSIDYRVTKKQSDTADAKIKSIANTIAKTNKSDFQKVKAVNEYITKNTSYNGSKDTAYTVYGTVIEQKAVCEGYALTAYQLLKALKMDAQYVVGEADGDAHAWNKVKVNGYWFNLDITWNDPLPNKPMQTSYNYFLLSDKIMKKDHSWDTKSYKSSTNTYYDFYADATYATNVGKTVYYANLSQNNTFYSYNVSTKKKQKISKARPLYILDYKNKLYYSDYANGGYLTVSDLNGKNVKVLNKSLSQYLYVKGNKLFYYTKNSWKSIKL